MQLSIADVIDLAQLDAARVVLAAAAFADGRRSAGWASQDRKSADQAAPSLAVDGLREKIQLAILSHPVVQMAAQPKLILGPAMVRYGVDSVYGTHIDDPLMDGVRADLSFTLFLSAASEYDGGELIIETAGGSEAVKLDAGHMFLYPANTLHRVATVTRGTRLVAVGWIRSFVRDAGQREILFELETARRTIFEQLGHTPTFDVLTKAIANLTRMWCDD